jgi:hypothetical protein
MPQPQKVEGTLGNLDVDNCKDNALSKAFYTIGRPSVRVSCPVLLFSSEHNLFVGGLLERRSRKWIK